MSFTELSGKVAGAISVLGGQANSNALNELRLIMRWVHAWVIPEQNRHRPSMASLCTRRLFER